MINLLAIAGALREIAKAIRELAQAIRDRNEGEWP